MDGPSYLVFKKERVEIGVRVISYLEAGAPSFYTIPGRRFNRIAFENIQGSRKQKVNKVVLHHDGMKSSQGCFRVLVQRNLSTHLMIDAKGTVFQPLDLSDTAWHCGDFNPSSVGVDLQNPIRPERIRDSLERTQRGVYSGKINGSKLHSLGYTDAQYESLVAVIRGLIQIFPKIKAEAPIGANNQVLRSKLQNLAFAGVVAHWHLSAAKWDPGPGFDWERMLIGIRGNNFYFPLTLEGSRNLAHIPKRQALKEAATYFRNTETGRGGYFPVGSNQAWHTGVHLNVPAGTPILAPADGELLVVRNTSPTPMGSPNMLLIRHKLSLGSSKLKFYSLLMHLRQEELVKESKIPWMRTLTRQDGPAELPDDKDEGDHLLAAPGLIALHNQRVALVKVPIKAGELLGYSDRFSANTDGSSMEELLDFAILSERPLLPPSDSTFERVEDDPDEEILCNARAVWKRYTQDPEALRGLVEGGYPLAPAEIRAFYAGAGIAEDGRKPHEEMRWLACKHVTEWSNTTDFSGLFGGGIDFEWSTRKQARRYLARIRKFLWWDKRVTEHAGLPQDRVIWSYQPIALLTVLALGEARKVLRPGKGGFMKALEGKALDSARKEDAEREQEHRHTQVEYRDISGGLDLYEEEEGDRESEAWMRWEQGEWPPESY